MKISELIKELRAIQKKDGDLEVMTEFISCLWEIESVESLQVKEINGGKAPSKLDIKTIAYLTIGNEEKYV